MTRRRFSLLLCLSLAIVGLGRSRAALGDGPELPGFPDSSSNEPTTEPATPADPPRLDPRPSVPEPSVPRPSPPSQFVPSPRVPSRQPPVTRGLDSDVERGNDHDARSGQSSRRGYYGDDQEVDDGPSRIGPGQPDRQPSRPSGGEPQRSLPSSRRVQPNAVPNRQVAPQQPTQKDQQRLQQQRLQQQRLQQQRLQQQQRIQQQRRLEQQQLEQQQRLRQQEQQLPPVGVNPYDKRRGQANAQAVPQTERSQAEAEARQRWEQPSRLPYENGLAPQSRTSIPSYRPATPEARTSQPATPQARSYLPPSRTMPQQRPAPRPQTLWQGNPQQRQQPQARNIPRPPWEASRRNAR